MDLRFGLRIGAFFCAIVMAAAVTIGCSEGSDIQLRTPATPNPLDPSDQPPDTTGAPKDPIPPPPSVPVEPQYRILCDDRRPPYIMAISSMASATGLGSGVEVGEPDATGKYDPLKMRNLEYHESPMIIELPKFGAARVLFSARRVPKNPAGIDYNRYIFISDLDLVGRYGIAKFIANQVLISGPAIRHADLESLSLRSFGVSDKGNFLLIGQSDGYRLLDAKTLRTIGILKVGSANTNFNPALRESDMIFSIATSNGTSFTSKLYSVGLTSSRALKSLTHVTSLANLRRPLAAVSALAGESFASLDTSNRINVLSPLKPASPSKSVIAALPKKGRLASSIVVRRDLPSKSLRAVIVFENFVPESSSSLSHYKIEQVFVRALKIDEIKLEADAVMADFEYPSESRSAIEMGIRTGLYPGVSDMRISTDGEAIFGLFPGSDTSQLYRLTAKGLTRVSQESCSGFSIGREP